MLLQQVLVEVRAIKHDRCSLQRQLDRLESTTQKSMRVLEEVVQRIGQGEPRSSSPRYACFSPSHGLSDAYDDQYPYYHYTISCPLISPASLLPCNQMYRQHRTSHRVMYSRSRHQHCSPQPRHRVTYRRLQHRNMGLSSSVQHQQVTSSQPQPRHMGLSTSVQHHQTTWIRW